MQTQGDLFERIFKQTCLVEQPPVLLDIGASGDLHANWQSIAKYSVCIAFDPDDREMDFISEKAKNFRQLYVVNKIVTDHETEAVDFYLTASPFCSSTLKPDDRDLSKWYFADLFRIEKKIALPAVSLQKALADLKIAYVDWFKSDSQGVDLRLFKNLGDKQRSVLVADFEPGFIDAYEGEDKIVDLLNYMGEMPFWLSSFFAGGNNRMRRSVLSDTFNEVELERLRHGTKHAPVFAEATYFNDFEQPAMKTERGYLLGCVFSMILKQQGFAAELAIAGKTLTGSTVFDEIIAYIKQTTAKPKLSALISRPALLKEKMVSRVISKLQKLL